MNANNNNNPAMNVDDYENMAVNNSNTAKRMAAGAAILVGGAAVAGGAAYAASTHDEPVVEDPLTPDTLLDGAEAAAEYEAPEPEPAPAQTTVYVVQPAPAPAPEPEPEVVWEETTNYYVDGEKFASVEQGRIDGTKFAIADVDNDGRADYFGYDENHNDVIEEHEIRQLGPNEVITMGNPTAHETNNNVISSEGEDVVNPFDPTEEPQGQVAHREVIRNNFEDEKTGESYRGDYAENNPDYNPDSDHPQEQPQEEPRYMASMDEPEPDQYYAGMPETEPEPEPEPEPDYMADIHNDADDFGGDECLV